MALTLQSLCSIHAYSQEEYMRREMVRLTDNHTGFWFLFVAASRWLGAMIDIMMALFQIVVLLTGVCLFLYSSGITSADVGFMLSYTSALMGLTQYMVRQSCEVDNLVRNFLYFASFKQYKS